MLLEKPLSIGDVVSIKTVSGDELVAKFQGESESDFKLNKPLVLAHTNQGMGLIPYMFTSDPDRDVNIAKNAVITISLSHDEMAKEYFTKTTGLQV